MHIAKGEKMKTINFKIPKNWKTYGKIRPFNSRNLKEIDKFHSRYDEESLTIISPSNFRIDLGWQTSFDANMNQISYYLRGVIVIDNDWDSPIEVAKLKTFGEAVRWVEMAIKKIEKMENNK